MITPEEFSDAALERAERATHGPWEASCYDSGHSKFEMDCSVVTEEMGDLICRMESLDRVTGNERDAKDDGVQDAWFIANARADIPKLARGWKAVLEVVNRLPVEPDLDTASSEYWQGAQDAYIHTVMSIKLALARQLVGDEDE